MIYDIVILDSGIDLNNAKEVDAIGLKVSKNKVNIFYDDIIDHNGHGTIIYNIIHKHSPSSKILIIKIYDDENYINENNLFLILKYVKENIKCRIINMSLGFKTCQNIKKYNKLCSDIVSNGTIIVSAFDNDNCYSYPACFDRVIGVDNNEKLKNYNDYEYIESSPINIRAKGALQRFYLTNNKVSLASGSSIACAYITARIANLCDEHILSLEKVLIKLKENAIRVFNSTDFVEINNDYSFIKKMKNVAVFPICKEMHAFIRFKDMLEFNILHFYDIRYSGRVGMKINKIYNKADPQICIEDIENATFTDIDTIILGHLDEINELCGYDYRRKIIQCAKEHAVNIYSFDSLSVYQDLFANSKIKSYYPAIWKLNVPQNTFGKLYKIERPVLGIFGTASKQGKFSLQLSLIHLFKKNNYRVGSIGTEPHSLLFNMDMIYPMGYNSTIFIDPWQSITFLNDRLHRLCEKNAEIIIVASQAASTPQNYNNLIDFPIKQNIFMMGTQPDAIVLCINIYDEISYIKNTIQVLQGLTDGKVIALVIYPLINPVETRYIFKSPKNISEKKYKEKSKLLTKEFNIPVYLLGNDNHLVDLYKTIIDYF